MLKPYTEDSGLTVAHGRKNRVERNDESDRLEAYDITERQNFLSELDHQCKHLNRRIRTQQSDTCNQRPGIKRKFRLKTDQVRRSTSLVAHLNILSSVCLVMHGVNLEQENGALTEPRYEKTGFLHMRKQRRRSASR